MKHIRFLGLAFAGLSLMLPAIAGAQVAMPTFKHGASSFNATGSVLLDSAGNDATDTTNHAVKVTIATAQPAGTNLVGDVGIQYRANATGAASTVAIMSPATPAGASIKASAGRLLGCTLFNGSAAVRSFKLYNATAVTMGTTAALYEVDLPASGAIAFHYESGQAFASGIMWAVTAGKGLTDNTTGTAANDVTGHCAYM